VQYYDGAAWATVGPTSSAVVQVKSTTKSDTFTTTSQTFTDITGLTVSITPTSASNKILVIASFTGSNSVGVVPGGIRLARGGTGIFIGDTAGSRTLGQRVQPTNSDSTLTFGLSFLDSPATTSATTYSVQCINIGNGTFTVNRANTDTDSTSYFRSASSITVMEVTP
jgi:hypothetical protein